MRADERVQKMLRSRGTYLPSEPGAYPHKRPKNSKAQVPPRNTNSNSGRTRKYRRTERDQAWLGRERGRLAQQRMWWGGWLGGWLAAVKKVRGQRSNGKGMGARWAGEVVGAKKGTPGSGALKSGRLEEGQLCPRTRTQCRRAHQNATSSVKSFFSPKFMEFH